MNNQNACLIEPLESRIAPATLTVTNLTDASVPGELNLRQAIMDLDNAHGGTIKFSATSVAETLTLTSDLPPITSSITITGPTHLGLSELTISASGFSGSSIFDVSGGTKGANVTLADLTISGSRGGSKGGAMYINDAKGTVTLTNDTFQGNSVGAPAIGSVASGGAVFLKTGTLNITSSHFTSNSATGGDGTTGYTGYDACGGALFITSGKATITGSTFEGNTAQGGAGGPGANLTADMGQNGGYAYGGAISNYGALTLVKTTVSSNTATGGIGGAGGSSRNAAIPGTGGDGGKAYGGGIYNAGTLNLVGCTISGNTARGGVGGEGGAGSHQYSAGVTGGSGGQGGFAAGGGIASRGGSHGKLYIGTAKGQTTSVISGNTAAGGSGGQGGQGGSGYSRSYIGYAGGTGGQGGRGGNSSGGGIYSKSIVKIANTTVSGNTASGGVGGRGGTGGQGGAAYVGSYPGNYTGGTGGNGGNGGNGGDSQGAGVYIGTASYVSSHSFLTITTSTISGNTASPGGRGGAGYYGNGGAVVYHGGPYSFGSSGSYGSYGVGGNSYGGGISASASKLSLVQSTIASNYAIQGGGIALFYGVNTQINNTTISGNNAYYTGGGIYAISSPINIISTVIGQNSAPNDADVHGSIFATNSLIQNLGDALVFDGGGSLFNVNPNLGSLANNGGLTETMLPGSGSLLIGAGSNPLHLTTDQRGDPRAFHGLVDIGAVEVGNG